MSYPNYIRSNQAAAFPFPPRPCWQAYIHDDRAGGFTSGVIEHVAVGLLLSFDSIASVEEPEEHRRPPYPNGQERYAYELGRNEIAAEARDMGDYLPCRIVVLPYGEEPDPTIGPDGVFWDQAEAHAHVKQLETSWAKHKAWEAARKAAQPEAVV
jgi:hypothetical protein